MVKELKLLGSPVLSGWKSKVLAFFPAGLLVWLYMGLALLGQHQETSYKLGKKNIQRSPQTWCCLKILKNQRRVKAAASQHKMGALAWTEIHWSWTAIAWEIHSSPHASQEALSPFLPFHPIFATKLSRAAVTQVWIKLNSLSSSLVWFVPG